MIKKINKFVFIIISFCISSISITTFILGLCLELTNKDFITSLNLPANADTLAIPIFGYILIGCCLILANLLFHVILFIISFLKKTIKTINIFDFLPKKGNDFLNIFKYITYVFIFFILVINIIFYNFIEFTILGVDVIFFITFMLSSLINLVWLTSFSKTTKK